MLKRTFAQVRKTQHIIFLLRLFYLTHEAIRESTLGLRSKASAVPMARLPGYTSVCFIRCSRGVCASWWPPLHGLGMVWCLSLPIKTWLGNCFSSQHPRLQSLTISQTLQQDTERWPAHALCPSCLSITGFLAGVSVKDRRLMKQKNLASAEWAEPGWSPIKGQSGVLLCLISRSPWKRLPQVEQVPLELPGFSTPTSSRLVLETSPTVDGGLSQTLSCCLWGM